MSRPPGRALIPLLFALGVGCQFGPPERAPDESGGVVDDTGGVVDDTDDTEDPEGPGDPTFEVNWLEDRLVFTPHGAQEGVKFTFGVAQTDACAQGCWTGEDCLNGQEGWAYCHPSGRDGLELVYGADPNTLVEGEQTVFTAPEFGYVATYMVTRVQDGSCWSFGHDPSYFAAAGCTVY